MVRTVVVTAVIVVAAAGFAGIRRGQAQSPSVPRDVVTKVIADEPGRVSFVQATRSGVYREVTVTWAPASTAGTSADAQDVVLDDGLRFVVQRASIEPVHSGAGFKISFDFFMPKESVPPPLIARRHERGSSPFAAVLGSVRQAISATALAAGNNSFSGSFTDVRTFIRPQGAGSPPPPEVGIDFRTRARYGTLAPRGGYCMEFETREAKEWVKKMRELNRQAAELGEGWLQQGALNASPEYQAIQTQRATLLAQDAAARSRMGTDSATARRAGRYMRGLDVAFAAMQAKRIQDQKQAFKERLAALRRCHQNPTNPLAQKAKTEDRATYDKIEQALDVVEVEVDAVSGVRLGASGINALAGQELGPAGAAMTGGLSEVEDALLEQTLEDSIASLEKCVVKCCGEKAAPSTDTNFTPGVASAPPTFTPGPLRPSQPPSAACKPPSHADVTYRHHSESSSCVALGAAQMCGARSTDTTFAGGADLRAVVTTNPDGSTEFEGYEGEGKVSMLIADDEKTSGLGSCPAGESRYVVTTGGVKLNVRAHPTIDNLITGGVDTGGMDRNTSVVEVFLDNDPVHVETTAQSCGEDRSSSGSSLSGTYSCHFYGVDLTTAGTYKQDKSEPGNDATGSCILTIY